MNQFLNEGRQGIDFLRLPSYERRLGLNAAQGSVRTAWKGYHAKTLTRASPDPRKEIPSGDSLQKLRSCLIKATVMHFQPTIFITDFEPVGVCDELRPTLEWLSRKESDCRVLLGLRDVLDDAAQWKNEWTEKDVYSALGMYDGIVVYGEKEIHDPVIAIGLPTPVHFVGYLGVDGVVSSKACTRPDDFEMQPGDYLLVAGGGGLDAAYLYDWIISLYESQHRTNLPPMCLVYGPNHPSTSRSLFEARIEALRALKGIKICTYVFQPPQKYEWLMRNAAGLVCMCGCNTFTEILNFDVKAICIPRESFRKEQYIRARVFEAKKVIEMLRAPMKISEKYPENALFRLKEAILRLPLRSVPSSKMDTAKALNGCHRLVHLLGFKQDEISCSNVSRSASVPLTMETVCNDSLVLSNRLEAIRDLRGAGDEGMDAMRTLMLPEEALLLQLEAQYMMSRVGHYETIPKGVLWSCCSNTEKLRHPDFFFLIGASKCGTSSIARHFLAHPQIAFQSRTGGMRGEQDDLSTNIGKWDDMEIHYYDVAAFSDDDIRPGRSLTRPQVWTKRTC